MENDKRKIKNAPAPGKQPKPSIVYGCAGAHPNAMPVPEAIAALEETAQFAFGNADADKFFDEVMRLAIAKQERREARDDRGPLNP